MTCEGQYTTARLPKYVKPATTSSSPAAMHLSKNAGWARRRHGASRCLVRGVGFNYDSGFAVGVPALSNHESWYEEKQSAWLYRELAQCEPDARIAELFRALAAAADFQADKWRADPGSYRANGIRALARARIDGRACTGARPATRSPHARGDEDARAVRLRRATIPRRPPDADLGRRTSARGTRATAAATCAPPCSASTTGSSRTRV